MNVPAEPKYDRPPRKADPTTYERMKTFMRGRRAERIRECVQQENAYWASKSDDVLSTAWILRLDHAEAEEMRASDERRALLCGGLALGCAALAVHTVWIGFSWVRSLVVMSASGQPEIPSTLWEPAIASTAAALFILSVGGLLFRVAHGYHAKALIHARALRRVRLREAALRLSLCTDDNPSVQAALQTLRDHMLRPDGESSAKADSGSGLEVPSSAGAAVLDKGASVVGKVAERLLG